METIKKGVYKHFKGNYYLVEDVAINTEDDSLYVVYRALYDESKLFIRPLESFLSPVDKEKYPDVKEEYRFEYQGKTIESKYLNKKL